MSVITIVLVDDHQVVTHSLKAYLESFPDLKVVGIAASGEELLARLDEWRPHVVLQDLLMPGGIDGIETTRRIIQRHPEVRVVALTASMDEARMMGCCARARPDTCARTRIGDAACGGATVSRGKTYIDPAISRQMLQAAGSSEALTPRETEVLRRVALGLSNKDIAAPSRSARRR